MSYLTQDEMELIRGVLSRAEQRSKQTAQSSKNGFFGWLRNTSLGWIVGKIIDWTWAAIKSIFF
jgi:hypothetical protein